MKYNIQVTMRDVVTYIEVDYSNSSYISIYLTYINSS